jgi:hypothetical protein
MAEKKNLSEIILDLQTKVKKLQSIVNEHMFFKQDDFAINS